MSARVDSSELRDAAVAALLEAFERSGLRATYGDNDIDVIVHGPAGPIMVEVAATAATDRHRVHALVHPGGGATPGMVQVLVADRIPDDARRQLRDAGWGYLDRRGRLWFRSDGIHVNDTDLGPLPRGAEGPASDPIAGRIGLGVAVTLLMHPHERLGPRELARRLDCSPSSAHDALRRLQAHALVDTDNRPLVPELFQVAAVVWKPERHYVAKEPVTPTVPAETAARYVLSGDLAAIELGASVVTSHARPLLYVPTAGELRRMVRSLGTTPNPSEAAAVLSAAPLPAVTDEDARVTTGWRVAHPVIVALDLAQDASRGGEILSDWTPEGDTRVW